MGNRAVISLGKKHADSNVGIYLHWNGSKDDIETFLNDARKLMADRIGDDTYCAARLIQVIGNLIPGNLSFGVGLCSELDCDNGDNGTYVVNPETLQIVEHIT